MPCRTGFFGHAGDSFRELAAMWAERGYVTIQPTSCQKSEPAARSRVVEVPAMQHNSLALAGHDNTKKFVSEQRKL